MKRKIMLGVLGALLAGCGTTDSAGPNVLPLFGGPPPPPPMPTTYSGRATVLAARIVLVRATVGDTGPLPASGGDLQTALLSVSVPGILNAGAATAATRGGGDAASSEATVANVSLGLTGLGVSAPLISSHTSAACIAGAATVSGGSGIAGLVVAGEPVSVTGEPNQTILVPGGRVVINEQAVTDESITVTALHVVLGGLTDVAVSQTHSDIHCGI